MCFDRPMEIKLQFLGAAGTVTGSKYLLSFSGKKLLVDAGLFQGERSWNEKNWLAPSFEPSSIDAVLITHAHIDHTGFLPRLYKLGLNCPIYATKATLQLSNLMLPDSGRLQEEEAEYRAEYGKSRHHPPLPLYTESDARNTLKLFTQIEGEKSIKIFEDVSALWKDVGHILGASAIKLNIGDKLITFSGDLGRYAVPILPDPESLDLGDLLLVESTYGDKDHPNQKPEEELGQIINNTVKRGGVVVIPSFAVGRAQLLLYYLRDLKQRKIIPDIPVIIDSPMATDATDVYRSNPSDCNQDFLGLLKQGVNPFQAGKMRFIKDHEESKRLNSISDPMIIISASGMLTGGRILHHLKHRIADPRNSIVFVGYQPPGGRGAWIMGGATSLTLLGDQVPIRAQIHDISSLSAHAGRSELLRWCRSCSGKPKKVAVVHGEPQQAKSFSESLKRELGWDSFVAAYLQEIIV